MQASAHMTLSQSTAPGRGPCADATCTTSALDLRLRYSDSGEPRNGGVMEADPLFLKGRCMLADRREFECYVEISTPNSMTVNVDGAGPTGSRVVAYIDGLGRVEGVVRRNVSGGIEVANKLTASKRERLARRIDWLLRRACAAAEEQRRCERDEKRQAHDVAVAIDGTPFKGQIIDESASGMAIALEARPLIGTYVLVEGLPAQVARYLENGIAIKFLRDRLS